MLVIYTGILFSCDSNKKSSKSFGKKGNTAVRKSPAKTINSSSDISPVNKQVSEIAIDTIPKTNEPQTRIDSLLEKENTSTYVRPSTNFQGASGVGTGASHASSYYARNKNKKQKQTITPTYRAKIQPDSLSIRADSIDYANNSW